MSKAKGSLSIILFVVIAISVTISVYASSGWVGSVDCPPFDFSASGHGSLEVINGDWYNPWANDSVKAVTKGYGVSDELGTSVTSRASMYYVENNTYSYAYGPTESTSSGAMRVAISTASASTKNGITGYGSHSFTCPWGSRSGDTQADF